MAVSVGRWRVLHNDPPTFICRYCNRVARSNDDMRACGGGCDGREEKDRQKAMKARKAARPVNGSLFELTKPTKTVAREN